MTVYFRNFGFFLKEVGRLYARRFEEHARSLGLTLMQCKALVHLAKNEGVSQARLCELTDIEPMAMVRIVDRMVADGWLVREDDPHDRRARRLRTTPKSKPIFDQIWRVADVTRQEFLRELSPAEQRAFMDAMDRIYATASALEPLNAETGSTAKAKKRTRPMPQKSKLKRSKAKKS